MPNHVTNIVNFEGEPEMIRKMLLEIRNDEAGVGSVDFGKLIPMPEALNIEAGSRTNDGLKAYNDFIAVYALGRDPNTLDLLNIPAESEEAFLRQRTDIDRTVWELGRAAFQNQQRYGAATWYSWCVRNWGTKWNAYDFSGNERSLVFNTAWSAPHPVLQKLSELYPEIGITHEWADEDIGQNCGRREYLGGKMTDEYYPTDDRASYEFAAGILNVDLSDYGLVLNSTGSNYIYCNSGSYDVIEVCGQRALLAGERLTPDDVPYGMYLYHVQKSETEEGTFRLTLPDNRGADHECSSVLTLRPVDLSPEDHIDFSEESAPSFLGEQMTMEEFMHSEASETEDEALGGIQL